MHKLNYFICYHLEFGWHVSRPNQVLSLGRGRAWERGCFLANSNLSPLGHCFPILKSQTIGSTLPQNLGSCSYEIFFKHSYFEGVLLALTSNHISTNFCCWSVSVGEWDRSGGNWINGRKALSSSSLWSMRRVRLFSGGLTSQFSKNK